MVEQRTNSRLQEVDVLRGLAAVTVVFSHYLPHWDRYLSHIVVLVPQALGYYGVKLFFVISGFVIFLTLERSKTVLGFAALRFSRLYPVYWASLLLVTAVSVFIFGKPFWPGGLVANATMFQEVFGVPHADTVYWSLSVEMAFYLNAAWLFGLGIHRRVHLIVFAWLALALLWVSAVHGLQPVTTKGLETAPRDWYALLFALDYAPYFSMGILFQHAQRNGWSLATAGLISLAIGVEFALASYVGVGVACVVAALFALAIHGHLRFLLSRVTLWLGAISYSLYLVHRNLGYLVLDSLHAHGVTLIPALLITVAGVVLIATALTYAVERPVLRLIRGDTRARLRRASSPARPDLHPI